MTLTANERAVVASVCPFPLTGIAEDQLGNVLDAWFASDHYDDNPAYTWNDEQEVAA